MPSPKTRIRLIEIAHPSADAVVFEPVDAPAFTGDDLEDLLCGRCETIIGDGVSIVAFSQSVAAEVDYVIDCPRCGAHNVMPTITIH